MKKIFTLFVSGLMAVSAMAQTYLWQEDFSSYSANDVPTGGDYSYVCVASGTKIYNDKLAGGTAPELLIGKSGGSFSATVPMNGKSGDLTLSYMANYDRVTVTVSEGAVLGEKSNSGNAYSFPVTVAEGTTSVTFTFSNSNSSNVRFDDVKFFEGEGKKPAGLSWGTASREVTIGSEENVFPTLSNSNNLTVTYSSDNEAVATIDAEGVITLVAAGKANISAAFAGNDEFEAQTVSYALTVKSATTVDITNTPETAYSVTRALELIAAGEGLEAKVYVKGTIKAISEVSTQYGNATFDITDGTSDIKVYRCLFFDNEKFTSDDQIKEGDEVIVYGKITLYGGNTNEITNCYIYSLNASSNLSNLQAGAAKNGKMMKDGQFVIVKNGKTYNAAGIQLR